MENLRIKSNPKILFLIDGIGALLSAFLLGVVLVRFESFFGIPPNVLYLLAAIPCFFAIYDFFCYYQAKDKMALYLRIIAFANISYCILSVMMAGLHRETISIWGWGYIVGEIIIVLLLAAIEIRTANSNIS